MEMLERDPTLTGRAITQKCQARYHAANQCMLEHRARAVMQDPAIRFPEYWSAILDHPNRKRIARSSAYYEFFAEVGDDARMDELMTEGEEDNEEIE